MPILLWFFSFSVNFLKSVVSKFSKVKCHILNLFNSKVMKFLVIFQKVIRLQKTWSFRKIESPFQEIIVLEKLTFKNLSLADETHTIFKTCFWILSHIEYFQEFEVNQEVALNLFPNSRVKIGSAKKFRCAAS